MLRMSTPPGEVAAEPRHAPHNIEAEQALLGAILVHNEAYERVSAIVQPRHFYDQLHASIYETTATMIERGQHVSPTTLATFFERYEPIDKGLTVPQYLVRLAANATTTAYARDYALAVKSLALRREIIVISEDAAAAAYDADIDVPPERLIEESEQALFALAEKGSARRGAVTFAESMNSTLDQINAAAKRTTKLVGLPTRLKDLDDMMGGLAPSDLIIIAGRPSMGKTTLATNIAWNVARKGKDGVPAPVGFFSLEMSNEQLTMRILAAEAGIPSNALRRGDIPEHKLEPINRTGIHIGNTPIIIDDEAGITIAQLATRARRMKREHGIELLVIDYIQLLRGSGRENRVQDVTEITVGLKGIAKDLNIPVIALSQLSRQVETRDNKRPQLSDLRESGSIEQDADVVLFVFREEYYVQRREPSPADLEKHLAWQQELERVAGISEVIIGKQRHGPTGTVRLAFDGELTRFSNLTNRGGS